MESLRSSTDFVGLTKAGHRKPVVVPAQGDSHAQFAVLLDADYRCQALIAFRLQTGSFQAQLAPCAAGARHQGRAALLVSKPLLTQAHALVGALELSFRGLSPPKLAAALSHGVDFGSEEQGKPPQPQPDEHDHHSR
jgi:hypothetical protein